MGIAAAVGDAVFKEEYSAIAQSRTDNLTAWALVSQAEMAFSYEVTGGENGVEKARQAVALDPGYALAHAVLGLEAHAVEKLTHPLAPALRVEVRVQLQRAADDLLDRHAGVQG